MAEAGPQVNRRGARLVAGVDGGGTSTRVLLADESGRVLGVGRSGSGNLHDVGAERLRAHLAEAWELAWSQAGTSPHAVDAICCAMASIGTGGNRSTVRRIMGEVAEVDADRVAVDIDLVGALAGGLGGSPGVAIIAGTGSSCFGRDVSGAVYQSGGWGSLLDDLGGATWLGTEAMRAAVRAFDGRDPATTLEAAVMEHFGLSHMRELLPRIDENAHERSARAQLARLVTREAAAGDAAALALLQRGAEALADCAAAVVRALDFGDGPIEVVVTGGLAEAVPDYRESIHRAVLAAVPRASCVLPRTSNVAGAALVALGHLMGDRPLDPSVRERLIHEGRSGG